MATINEVSDYIILSLTSEGESDLNTLKLQKLLYYTQAWNLAFYDRPLFDGKFQAWIHGPVNREIYDVYKGSKYLYSGITKDDVKDPESPNRLNDEEKAHIDGILETYAPFTSSQLEHMTHKEEPWVDARGGISAFERCENLIREDLMRTYYKARL